MPTPVILFILDYRRTKSKKITPKKHAQTVHFILEMITTSNIRLERRGTQEHLDPGVAFRKPSGFLTGVSRLRGSSGPSGPIENCHGKKHNLPKGFGDFNLQANMYQKGKTVLMTILVSIKSRTIYDVPRFEVLPSWSVLLVDLLFILKTVFGVVVLSKCDH